MKWSTAIKKARKTLHYVAPNLLTTRPDGSVWSSHLDVAPPEGPAEIRRALARVRLHRAELIMREAGGG